MHPSSGRAQPLRSAAIVHLALIVGLLTFGAVAVGLVAAGEPLGDPALADTLLPVLALLAVAEAPAWLVVRKTFDARLAERADAAREELARGELPPELFQVALIGSALAEGVGLFGVVIHLLTGAVAALAAPAVAVVLIAVLVPTRAKGEARLRALTRESH